MTKKEALVIALSTIDNEEAKTVITSMIEQLSKSRPVSDEKRAERNAKRKADTAKAREELVSKVAPVLRKYLTNDVTAKELFEMAKNELPEDYSAPKVQNILLREMSSELVKTETKGKANTYRLA